MVVGYPALLRLLVVRIVVVGSKSAMDSRIVADDADGRLFEAADRYPKGRLNRR